MHISHYDWSTVKFVDIFRVIGTAGTKFSEHGRCDIYQIGLKIYGESEILYNHKKYLFGGESILYLPKEPSADIDYQTTITEQGESLCIFFDSPNKLPPEPFFLPHSSAYLRNLFFELHHHYNSPQKDIFACRSIFYNILSNLNQEHDSQTICMENVIAYMQNHITDAYIDFSAIAKENNMSIDYFRHAFKNTYNTAPLQFFHKLKMDYIKTLMHNSTYSIKDIAKIAGFHDFNYFSRFFKKHAGVSPREYKRSHLS